MMHLTNSIRFHAALLVAGLVILGLEVHRAQAQVFNVDTNRSSVTISGNVAVAGGTIMTQGPGSLTAAIGGTIQVALAGNTIQFTGQSKILAETNGSWQPKADGTAGAEPADFGGQANLGIASGVAALRDIQLDAISPPINIVSGQFDSTNLTFLFPSNSLSTLAYNFSGLISTHGSDVLSGYATNKVTSLASLATVGNQQVLTIPVDATFLLKLVSPNDTTIRLQGQLVAVQSTQTALQVQSLAIQNQSILLQWQGQPGSQFQIQSSTNLSRWQTNAAIVTPASGTYTWTGAVSGPVKFFRLAK
jgi:hypothetical protein